MKGTTTTKKNSEISLLSNNMNAEWKGAVDFSCVVFLNLSINVGLSESTKEKRRKKIEMCQECAFFCAYFFLWFARYFGNRGDLKCHFRITVAHLVLWKNLSG